MKKTKPKVEFHSRGESGNTLYILMLVESELRKQHQITVNHLRELVLSSRSYEEALGHMRQKVNLVDLDGEY